jgi:hypothetical protein
MIYQEGQNRKLVIDSKCKFVFMRFMRGDEISICNSIESLHFIDSVRNLLVVDKKVIVVVHHNTTSPNRPVQKEI